MSRQRYYVYIPYDEYDDFEVYLYAQLNYPDHGYTRTVNGVHQLYLLDLEESDATMILLQYKDAVVKQTPKGFW